MKRKKVAIIFTGGTISMKIDPRIHAAIPALSSEEILSMVTNIEKAAEIEIIDFANLPSPHITPDIMMKLSQTVKKTISREDINGVVVTHGTDTLEETAYLLDLTIKTEKPIVVVGAMRNSSELGYDGSSNLSAATNTLSLDTFKSPEFGPLGIIDNDEVIFYRDIPYKQHIQTESIESKVGLVKCVSGMESDILHFLIDSGYKGIVLEALGRGNIPPKMMEGVEKSINKNIPVVMVSRCPTGRVLDSYGYAGGGKTLRELGVIFGGDLPGQKARIKLMLALSITDDIEVIRYLFERKEHSTLVKNIN